MATKSRPTVERRRVSLWSHVLAELDVPAPDDVSPERIRRALQALATGVLIIIDELDRLEDDDALTALADTIKSLSDHAIDSTIVLAGVGRSIGELIGEHASIVRALVQIEMPRMSLNELAEILWNGSMRAGLTVRPGAVEEITLLSEGLPHYAHLLGPHGGLSAVQNDRSKILQADVRAAIPKAVNRHTILNDYQQATRSARKDALFSEVLLACALAPKIRWAFSPPAQSATR